MSAPLVVVDHVSRQFVKPLGWAEALANRLGGDHHPVVVRALDDVTLTIARGEVLGIVGESGCGKAHWVGSLLAYCPRPRERCALRPAVVMRS